MVSFTLLPLYYWGYGPPYPSDRRLGEPLSWSGRYGEEKRFLPLPLIEPGCSTRSLVTIPIELFRLLLAELHINGK
jgi:hypothetical protein